MNRHAPKLTCTRLLGPILHLLLFHVKIASWLKVVLERPFRSRPSGSPLGYACSNPEGRR
jgi:hypothetical protein